MRMLRYRDFILTFTADGSGGYVARVTSPQGEGRVSFRVPFTEDKLELLVLKLGRTRSRTRRSQSPELAVARELGGALFDAVFTGEVRDCLRTSINEVRRSGEEGLRLKLRLQHAPGLAELPWELLLDATTDTFLAQSIYTPIVRWVDLAQPVRPITVAPPLRILVMVSSPTDYTRLDVEHEKRMLTAAMQELIDRGRVEITFLERATMRELQRTLRHPEPIHIFHFIGHGEYDDRAEGGLLVLEDEQERGARVEAHRLAALLRDHTPLRLAVLNACEGARNSRTDPFAGVATTLVRQGIPAVIAMQFEITDAAAIGFAREFYGAIADGIPLDAAVSEARKAIYALPNDTEWATPVLYMRTPDGEIFDIAEREPDESGATRATARESERADSAEPEPARHVRFTTRHPRVVKPAEWLPLVVSAYVVPDVRQDPDRPAPADLARDSARRALGDAADSHTAVTDDAAAPVAEGSELLVLPRAPGVEFDPPHRVVAWRDVDWANAYFRMKADASLDGEVARGTIIVLNGPLLIAEMPLEFRVGAGEDELAERTAEAYRRIFVSYARLDEPVVRRMEAYARALGDEYLRDVTTLRAGERSRDRLLALIDEADVFQLFWSRNALASDTVDEEVRHALALERPNFVRPFYWEPSLAKDVDRDRPPAALRDLHFQRIDLGEPAEPPAPGPRPGGGDDVTARIPRVAPPATNPVDTPAPPPIAAAPAEPGPPKASSGVPWYRKPLMRYGTPLAAMLATILVVARFAGGAPDDPIPLPIDSTRPPPDTTAPVPPPPPPVVASLALTPRQNQLDLGASRRLSVRAQDSAGFAMAALVGWTSANPAVVRVDASSDTTATIRGVSAGSTWVLARAGEAVDSVLVRVLPTQITPPPNPPPPLPPPPPPPEVTDAEARIVIDRPARQFTFHATFTPFRSPPGPLCMEWLILVNGDAVSSERSDMDVDASRQERTIELPVPFAEFLPDEPLGDRRIGFEVRIWPAACNEAGGPPLADIPAEPVCMVKFVTTDWRREDCSAARPEPQAAGR